VGSISLSSSVSSRAAARRVDQRLGFWVPCCCASVIHLFCCRIRSLAMCSCIRTDREESEVIRYNGPATAHVFCLRCSYCLLQATALACNRTHLYGTKRFCAGFGVREARRRDCAKGHKYNIADAFRDHSMKTHSSSSNAITISAHH
jgi:hypothetical protein